jgi:hypothetical protein
LLTLYWRAAESKLALLSTPDLKKVPTMTCHLPTSCRNMALHANRQGVATVISPAVWIAGDIPSQVTYPR